MADFFIFRMFDELPKAKEFECFLIFHRIEVKREENENGEIVLQVQKADENKIETLLNDTQSGYDLLNLSSEELLMITQQRAETNKSRHRLALGLLKIRVKTIHAIQRNKWEEERLKEEYKPAHLSVAMYWFILLSTLFGGIGVLLALHVVSYKRKLSNGQRVYLYSEDDRTTMKWALRVFGLFVLCFVGYLLFSLNQKIN